MEHEILQHLDLLRKDARVRVKQWLDKLRQEVGPSRRLALYHPCSICKTLRPHPALLPAACKTSAQGAAGAQSANAVWRRNRNLHARLLLECLRAGRLREPFTALPPPGLLPALSSTSLAHSLPHPKQPNRDPADSRALVPVAASCPPEQADEHGAWHGSDRPASHSGEATCAALLHGVRSAGRRAG